MKKIIAMLLTAIMVVGATVPCNFGELSDEQIAKMYADYRNETLVEFVERTEDDGLIYNAINERGHKCAIWVDADYAEYIVKNMDY